MIWKVLFTIPAVSKTNCKLCLYIYKVSSAAKASSSINAQRDCQAIVGNSPFTYIQTFQMTHWCTNGWTVWAPLTSKTFWFLKRWILVSKRHKPKFVPFFNLWFYTVIDHTNTGFCYICVNIFVLCLMFYAHNILPKNVWLGFYLFQFGSILHYASLCSMLSLTFMARNICKDVCNDPLKALDRNEATKSTILR